ncbi:unnamed protein product [Mytilus coruscus]|uniref:Ig-like domain-containing protein n=1 Tax=Mytilus coruscus TaxID=42192 RepID=A0A6J8EK06_MYTCO|nr:unnamed protein product [Mytilus coruscus]
MTAGRVDKVTLTCDAYGNPSNYTYRWTQYSFNDEFIREIDTGSKQLTLSSKEMNSQSGLRYTDSGKYGCMHVITDSVEYGISDSETVVFDSVQNVNMKAFELTLTISNVIMDDFTEYKISIVNDYGIAEKTFKLNPSGKVILYRMFGKLCLIRELNPSDGTNSCLSTQKMAESTVDMQDFNQDLQYLFRRYRIKQLKFLLSKAVQIDSHTGDKNRNHVKQITKMELMLRKPQTPHINKHNDVRKTVSLADNVLLGNTLKTTLTMKNNRIRLT